MTRTLWRHVERAVVAASSCIRRRAVGWYGLGRRAAWVTAPPMLPHRLCYRTVWVTAGPPGLPHRLCYRTAYVTAPPMLPHRLCYRTVYVTAPPMLPHRLCYRTAYVTAPPGRLGYRTAYVNYPACSTSALTPTQPTVRECPNPRLAYGTRRAYGLPQRLC